MGKEELIFGFKRKTVKMCYISTLGLIVFVHLNLLPFEMVPRLLLCYGKLKTVDITTLIVFL